MCLGENLRGFSISQQNEQGGIGSSQSLPFYKPPTHTANSYLAHLAIWGRNKLWCTTLSNRDFIIFTIFFHGLGKVRQSLIIAWLTYLYWFRRFKKKMWTLFRPTFFDWLAANAPWNIDSLASLSKCCENICLRNTTRKLCQPHTVWGIFFEFCWSTWRIHL